MHKNDRLPYMSSVRDYLTIFFKYKWMIIGIFLIVSMVGLSFSFQVPTMYEARASILVKLGHEFMYRSETLAGGYERGMS